MLLRGGSWSGCATAGIREMVLAMTHEEIVAWLAASEVDSYQRLPRLVYQIPDRVSATTRVLEPA